MTEIASSSVVRVMSFSGDPKMDLHECETSSSETSHTTTNETSRSASVSPGMFSSFRKMSEMWHPHVYAHPPKKPTPFSIDDILQQQQEQQQQQQQLQRQQQQQQQQQQHLQFQIQQKTLLDGLSLLSGGSLSLQMGQLEMASALRSMAAAACMAATSAHSADAVSPSPTSTCGSSPMLSSRLVGVSPTPVADEGVDQPLNLTTKKSFFSASAMPPLTKIDSGDSSTSGGAASKGLKRKLKESSSSIVSTNKFESDSLSLSEAADDEDSKKKKVRTTFTGRQIFELEKMFETKKYLSSSERSDMAKLLNVTEQQVKIWFQNRRTKWKKQENISNAEAAELMKSKGTKEALMTSSSPSSSTSSKSKHISGNGNRDHHMSGNDHSPRSSCSSGSPGLSVPGQITENGLSSLLGKLSPGPTFNRPSSSASNGSSTGKYLQHSPTTTATTTRSHPEIGNRKEVIEDDFDEDVDDDEDDDRLVIEEQHRSDSRQNNNNNNSLNSSHPLLLQKETFNATNQSEAILH